MYTEQKNIARNTFIINPEDNGFEGIYTNQKGVAIAAVIHKDEGTMECKVVVAAVYPDGEVSRIHEYSPKKLTSYRAMMDLADMADIDGEEEVKTIYKALDVRRKNGTLKTVGIGNEKCGIRKAYQALTEYVTRNKQPGLVFIEDGYGNIEYKYLTSVLNDLQLGYTRLELAKNLRAWGLIRWNNGTGHNNTFKIKRKWYLSFKLADLDSLEGGERA